MWKRKRGRRVRGRLGEGGGKDEPDEGTRTRDPIGGGNQRGMETAGSRHGTQDVCDEKV